MAASAATDPASDRERTRLLVERYRAGVVMKPSELDEAKRAIRIAHAELRAREAY